jgi:hypothetical protein
MKNQSHLKQDLDDKLKALRIRDRLRIVPGDLELAARPEEDLPARVRLELCSQRHSLSGAAAPEGGTALLSPGNR